jgi:Domain of unknown function (DUF3067)
MSDRESSMTFGFVSYFSCMLSICNSKNCILMKMSRSTLILFFSIGLWKVTQSFVVQHENSRRIAGSFSSLNSNNNNWLGDLWQEVIEFSTYGPSERRILKGRREAATLAAADDKRPEDVIVDRTVSSPWDMDQRPENQPERPETATTDVSMKAFQAAKVAVQERKNYSSGNGTQDQRSDVDGYALRDLIVDRWGVPLDVSFQRGSSGASVYVTILPVVAFDDAANNRRRSRQARHENELEYLQHLQAVIEILHRYDNLGPWIDFLKTTSRVPQPGKESISFRLTLSPSDQQKILGGTTKKYQ